VTYRARRSVLLYLFYNLYLWPVGVVLQQETSCRGSPAVAGAVQNAVGKVLVSASMTVLLPAPTIHSPHRSILFLVCQGPTSLNLQINTFSCYLVTHY